MSLGHEDFVRIYEKLTYLPPSDVRAVLRAIDAAGYEIVPKGRRALPATYVETLSPEERAEARHAINRTAAMLSEQLAAE